MPRGGHQCGLCKPHGALYNTAAVDQRQARAVVKAVAAYDSSLPILGLPGSVLLAEAAAAGLRTVREAFADRGYTPEGGLVPRDQPGALLSDPDEVAARMLRLAMQGRIRAVDGSDLAVEADSICTHGDSPGAVAMARAIRAALEAAGVEVRAFVDRSLPWIPACCPWVSMLCWSTAAPTRCSRPRPRSAGSPRLAMGCGAASRTCSRGPHGPDHVAPWHAAQPPEIAGPGAAERPRRER